jgi:hypothetical protein
MDQLELDNLPETFFANYKSNSIFKPMNIPKAGLGINDAGDPEGD